LVYLKLPSNNYRVRAVAVIVNKALMMVLVALITINAVHIIMPVAIVIVRVTNSIVIALFMIMIVALSIVGVEHSVINAAITATMVTIMMVVVCLNMVWKGLGFRIIFFELNFKALSAR